MEYNHYNEKLKGDLYVWLLYDNNISGLAHFILGFIIDAILSNNDGFCSYTNKVFAEYFGTSHRTITKHISQLSDSNYIQSGFDEKTQRRTIILGSKAYQSLCNTIVEDFIPGGLDTYSTNNRSNISVKKRFNVLKRDKYICQYCGLKAPDVTLEIDHIIPTSKGGSSIIDNLTTSCWDCNRGKGSILIKERKNGRL